MDIISIHNPNGEISSMVTIVVGQPYNQLLLEKRGPDVGEEPAVTAAERMNHKNETASRSWLRGFSWEHSDNTQCGEHMAVFHTKYFIDKEIWKDSIPKHHLENS